jgi:hypothetical protein
MKATIYIPDKLEKAVKNYLEIYPEKTLSSLVQESLENKLLPRKSRLLELAGFVGFDPKKRSPEQMADDERQRPEDEPAKRGR